MAKETTKTIKKDSVTPDKNKKSTTSIKKDSKASASNKAAFAVVETGGKQYKVKEGDFITVEKLEGDVGDNIKLETVLLFDDGSKTDVGDPYIKGKKVETEIVEAGKLKKINVVRFKSKSRYYKKKGHRQNYTTLKILKV